MLERLSISLIQIYQRYIRWALSPGCRFSPSCSEYTKQAMLKYGFLKGNLKAAKRLLQCHPFSGKDGYDPLI